MAEKITLDIHGMTCAACVRRVEEGLRGTPGVLTVAVNFATEKALVEYDADRVDIDKLRDKVRDLGYEAFTEAQGTPLYRDKVTISVGGMTCAACVRRVEN
ncbi:MAG TPA: copper ion binding protein, partial [Smithellaceae bacterium]|nr:copper ion binding protein [Smithellaceae bacterium]